MIYDSESGDFNLVVTGIGGTGVVTIGALLGMAAHVEGKGCSVLDSIGLAPTLMPLASSDATREAACFSFS